jgi:hypothetical protein
MKKLLMLVLVLGIASLANAAPLFSTTPGPDTISFSLLTSGVPECDIYIDYTPLIGLLPGFDPFAATLSGVEPINALTVQTIAVDGYNMWSIAFASTGNLPTGNMGTLDINGAAANVGSTPVALPTYDMDGAQIGDTTIFVPEPATIALLCLGGLLLRKKK